MPTGESPPRHSPYIRLVREMGLPRPGAHRRVRPVADQSIQFRPRSAAPPAVAGGGAKTLLAVQGMTCGNCARHVTEALQSVPGVAFAAVDKVVQLNTSEH